MSKNLRIWLLSLFLLSGLLLSGCARESKLQIVDEQKPPVHLTFFGFKTGATKVEEIEQILNAYMTQHPNVVITYEGSSKNYTEILTKRLESGNADDLFMISPTVFSTYAQKGWIGDKIANLADCGFLSRLNPYMRRLITVDGQVAGAPMCMSVVGMMVNLDILRACGIAEVPQTYGAWTASMERIRKNGYTPMLNYLGNDASPMFLAAGRTLAPPLYQKNAATAPFTPARFQAGLADVHALMDAGFIDRTHLLENANASSYKKVLGGAFAAGKAAYAVVPCWGLAAFLSGNPSFSYRYCGLPLSDDGPVALVRASVPVGVNNQSAHKKEALDFLEFLMRPEHIEAYAASQHSLSPLHDAKTDDPLFSELLSLTKAGKSCCDADPQIPFNVTNTLNAACSDLAAGRSLAQAARRLQ